MKTIEDIRHAENSARLAKLEQNHADTALKLDTLIRDTAGLVEFIKDSKVGLKWSGRLGKFLRILGQLIIGGLTIYGAYQAWRNGLPNPMQK